MRRCASTLYQPEDASGLLLFGHGGAQSKDSDRFVRLCRTYAEETGLADVCIDAVDHGERKPPGPSGPLPQQWHSRAIPQLVANWHRASEALSAIGPPVAYVGFSMGVIFGAPTVASMPTIKVAVFGVGGPKCARAAVLHGKAIPSDRLGADPPSRCDRTATIALRGLGE